ncbi:N-acetyl-beta-hexosaminidase [Tritrichomonas foetus]|uniref:beta-N-acetylhexosaminidase n=1 Tax=Tritrichomonas foetus TaxID=1144522 RepID=A0A1J4JGY6_9EUKA|nr:N-acetyl-beta-hexosaminidase [Tritrichomonas foetus]|eukprot:OHS96867.1 N-acetyl-beta-hexosaminidase [Tritrichomonas foetus]
MFSFFLALCSCTLNLIPEPKSISVGTGFFTLKSTTGIYYDKSVDGLVDVVNYAAKIIRVSTGFAFIYKDSSENDQINFIKSSKTLGNEEYQLFVKENVVEIVASTTSGFLYGFETLLQLFPPEIYSKGTISAVTKVEWKSPCVEISDSPRFEWRGLMLDVSRHFYDPKSLRALFDAMAHQKLNYIHLHLTDDQGWRLEIKKYPKMTTVGSKSAYRPKPWFRDESDDVPYGPFFYTQEEMKELIHYARVRGITIVPEIDLPAHALAALAAYPELSCTGGPFEPQSSMAASKDVFCLGNDNTLKVLYEVLDEVMDLFETKYLHVGGDECPTDRWQACEKCKKRYQELKLTNYQQLQYWFTDQLLAYIESKGHILVGWDEIYNDKMSKSAMIMGWHVNQGIKAANNGHKVVMCPTQNLYICQYQYTSPDVFEYATFGYKTLRVQYDYEGTAGISEANKGNVLGIQGALWTEWVWGEDVDLFWKLFPRMTAIAENAWCEQSKKDYNRFLTSLIRAQEARFDHAQIVHAPAGQAQGCQWKESDLRDNWTTKKWTVLNGLGKQGPYEVAFILTSGTNSLKIKNVKLLIDDEEVATSTQEGEAAWEPTGNNIFKLQTNASGANKEVTIMADILGNGGNDSEGTVVLYYTQNT